MTCCQPGCYDAQFSDRVAKWDLKRYRRKGPVKTTRLLIEALEAEGVAGCTLLDIGGGIGAIHHELLDAGARSAVQIDAAGPYIEAASREAARRGHAEHVSFIHGDFVAAAAEVPAADIVTLDRVICCYPDMERLVTLSAEKTRGRFGAVYPRERWLTRIGLAAVNVVSRVRRLAFRTYVHSPAAIDAVLRAQGLTRRAFRRTFMWEVAVYSRAEL